MSNHPSRAWRRRAEEAAAKWAPAAVPLMAGAEPGGEAVVMTLAQLDDLMRRAFVIGYGDGRQDHRREP